MTPLMVVWEGNRKNIFKVGGSIFRGEIVCIYSFIILEEACGKCNVMMYEYYL